MLSRFLVPRTEAAYALMRIGLGLAFAFHGIQKVFGVLAKFQPPLFSQLGVGGVIELVCGLAIAVGAFTRWAAFLASGTMAVAYTQFHWKLGLGAQLLPAINGGELALVYSLCFLFVACRGAGWPSVDAWRAGEASPRSASIGEAQRDL